MVQLESGGPRGIQRPPERPGRQRHPASASKSGGVAQHLAPSISRFTRCIVPLPAPVSRMTLRMLSPAASRRRICASTSVRGRPCGFFSVPILLAAESSTLGATIPFNSVMIATFFLTGLDISHRVIRWCRDQGLDWSRTIFHLRQAGAADVWCHARHQLDRPNSPGGFQP